MSDWTDGYMAELSYAFAYHGELNPLRARLALLGAGLSAPRIDTACELGFGQGLSVNFHAAASAVQWYGTDFNPAHARFAQELAEASGAGARLYADAFDELAARSDLPDFDFIALHGIWAWVSEANRAVIVDFVRRKLKAGGILYISYNAQPGWAAFAPMRHLMNEHASIIGAKGQGVLPRIDAALAFAEKLLATNPHYARASPRIAERIRQIKGLDRSYVAHEYFDRDWLPMHFGTVVQWLAPAKLAYACSAYYPDHLDTINLTGEQQAFLAGIPDTLLRESARDFMVNRQFRRDYFVKGARPLNGLAQAEAFGAQAVQLTTPRGDVPLKIMGGQGEARLTESIYDPILDLLADYKAHTIGRISEAVASRGVAFGQAAQAVLVLAASGHLTPVQDEAAVGKARKQTERLNAHLIDKARGSNDIAYLASPISGGGVSVGRTHQLFLLARAQGRKQPAEWAAFAWETFRQQGQRLVKDGKPLATDAENLAELTAQARSLADKQLPILKALQIA